MTGLIYGVGFVIGSAIIATIGLGILGPLLTHIPGVQNAFESGATMIRR